MKTCSTCKSEKPLSEFYRNRTRPDGYAHQCKKCRGFKRKRYPRKGRPDVQVRYQIKRKYGISVCDLTRMRIEHGDLCAICRQPSVGQRLSIDHCHETGIVRGLLCSPCNLGLGSFRDSVERLESAIRYLGSR